MSDHDRRGDFHKISSIVCIKSPGSAVLCLGDRVDSMETRLYKKGNSESAVNGIYC